MTEKKSEAEKLLEGTRYYVIGTYEDNGVVHLVTEAAFGLEGVYNILEMWYASETGYCDGDNRRTLLRDLESGTIKIIRGWKIPIFGTTPDTIKELVTIEMPEGGSDDEENL